MEDGGAPTSGVRALPLPLPPTRSTSVDAGRAEARMDDGWRGRWSNGRGCRGRGSSSRGISNQKRYWQQEREHDRNRGKSSNNQQRQ
ncbi:hypothetical protein ACHAXS_007278 [Conticribra weissflogii]